MSLSCSLGKLHDSNLSRGKENLVTFNIRLIVPKSENTLYRLYLDFDPISTELKNRSLKYSKNSLQSMKLSLTALKRSVV